MVDEVEMSFYDMGFLCSLFGHIIGLVISNDVCVGFDHAYVILRWEF